MPGGDAGSRGVDAVFCKYGRRLCILRNMLVSDISERRVALILAGLADIDPRVAEKFLRGEKLRRAAGERAERGIKLWARMRAALEQAPDNADDSTR